MKKPKNLEELKKWIIEWEDLTNVDISGLDSLEWAFKDIKEYKGSIKDWDTSNIKNFSYCFFLSWKF